MATTKANTNNRASGKVRVLALAMACILALCTASAWSAHTTLAYAKDIGKKNEDQYNAVERVAKGEAPSKKDYDSNKGGYYGDPIPYTDVNGDASVFVGGNATSNQNGTPLDNDPNDFSSVLPYGTVYIDVDKLNFNNAEIDIKDKANFAWVAPSTDITDAKGNHPDLAVGNYQGVNLTSCIAYIGGLDAYLSNTQAYKDTEDTTKDYQWLNTKVDANYQGETKTVGNGSDVLYSFTFYNAATLPDGTQGNVVIKATKVVMESSIDIAKGAPIGIHEANYIGINQMFYPVDGAGYTITEDAVVYADGTTVPLYDATSAAAYSGPAGTGAGLAIKAYLPSQDKVPVKVKIDPNGSDTPANTIDSHSLLGFGLQLSFDIEVQDVAGNKVAGSISYATNDLDVGTRQTLWGRVMTGDPAKDYMFAEGLTIDKGSQSYAVVPNYDHANGNNQANGKLVMPKLTAGEAIDFSKTVDHPLLITRVTTGTGPADGVKFSSSGLINFRNSSGTFEPWQNASGILPFDRANLFAANGTNAVWVSEAFFNANEKLIKSLGLNYEKIYTVDGNPRDTMNDSTGKKRIHAYRENEIESRTDANGNTALYAKTNKYVDGNYANTKVLFRGVFVTGQYDDFYGSGNTTYNTTTTKRLTYKKIFDALNPQTFTAERGDNSTFDSGFAVLLDSAGSSMTWSGSQRNNGQMRTQIFDTSMFTRVEQSHGTGGGIYLEGYRAEKQSNTVTVKSIRNEGVVTMGKDTETTVTVVPEDGYRVKSIIIGNATIGNPENGGIKALTDREKYIIDGNDVKDKNDNVVGTFKTTTLTDGTTVERAEINGFKYQKTAAGQDTATRDQSYSGKFTFERNADGSIDVTLPVVDGSMHVHADYTTDYYFYKVWKKPAGSSLNIPNTLELKATPFSFKMTDVTIGGVKYNISDEGTKYTQDDDPSKVYILTTNYKLTIGSNTYTLVGENLVADDGTEYSINHKITSGTGKPFTVDKNKSNVTVLQGSDSKAKELVADIEDTDEVWKIKYPADGKDFDGDGTLDWPALPVESYDGSEHNYTHVQRNYWFVTEKAPDGWSMVDYDNERALAPGVITAADRYQEDPTKQDNSLWVEQSGVYHDAVEHLIESQEANDHAFMSPISSDVKDRNGNDYKYVDATDKNNPKTYYTWGGRMTNYPSIIIKAEKVWEGDFNNDFDTRQDVLFHLDATFTNEKGLKRTVQDYLAPIKIAKDAKDNALKVAWGDKSVYTTDDPNVEILGNADGFSYKESDGITDISYAPLPESDGRAGFVATSASTAEDSHNGKLYFINELSAYDKNGRKIEYSIRETSTVKKADGSGYEPLIGYELLKVNGKEFGAWDNMTSGTETVGTVNIPTKSGTATNKLELTDFSVTKVWYDGKTHDEAADAATLKSNYTLYENDKAVDDAKRLDGTTAKQELKLQPSKAVKYVPASTDQATGVETPASGTLETKSGKTDDGKYTTTTFIWHNIPKYVGDKDASGNDIVREAVYSIKEKTLDGYAEPVYTNEGAKSSTKDKALDEGTINNTQKAAVTITKRWDDALDTSNRVDTTYSIVGEWSDSAGKHTYSKSAGPDAIKTAMADKTITKDTSASANADAGSATWKDLPAYSASGEKITYTVTEESTGMDAFTIGTVTAVTDYENGKTNTTDTGDLKGVLEYKYTITNKLKTVDVKATKVWEDNNNQDGYRNDATFTLTPNDAVLPTGETKTKTIAKTATGNDLTASWNGLPAYHNGTEVKYSVTENSIDNYTTSISTPTKNSSGNWEIIVTNTHTPETAKVKVVKKWDDNNNQDGLRTTPISFKLVGTVDDSGTAKTVSTNTHSATIDTTVADNAEAGAYTWENLPLYKDGKKISYTLTEETSITGYTTTYTAKNADGTESSKKNTAFKLTKDGTYEVTVTNAHTPATTSLTITKTWNDTEYFTGEAANLTGDNNAYTRPDLTFTITATYKGTTDAANVFDDGGTAKNTKTVTLTGDKTGTENTWTTTETGLPVKFDGGKDVKYTVAETTPEAFTKSGENVTYDFDTSTWDDKVTNTPEKEDKVPPLTILKKDANTDGNLAGAVFTVTKEGAASGKTTQETDVDGKTTFAFTEDGTYTISETTVPEGYEKAADVTVKVDKKLTKITLETDNSINPATSFFQWLYELFFGAADNPTNLEKTTAGGVDSYTLTIADEPIKANILVKKNWNDADNKDGKRTGTMPTVKLQKSTDPTDDTKWADVDTSIAAPQSVPDANGTNDVVDSGKTFTWENLPAYENGKRLTYRVVEDGKLADYDDPAYNNQTFALANAAGTQAANQTATVVTNTYVPKPDTTPMTSKDGQYQKDGDLRTQSVDASKNFTANGKLADGTDNAITKIELDVPDGVEGATKKDDGSVIVPGEGTYTIDDGVITFTPKDGFTGKSSGVKVVATDKAGNTIDTTYTPIVVPNKEVQKIERTIEYRYTDASGNEVVEKKTQTVTVERIGDYNQALDDHPGEYRDTDSQDTIGFSGNNNGWTPKDLDAVGTPDDDGGWVPDQDEIDAITGITPDNAAANGFIKTTDPKTGEIIWKKTDLVTYTPQPPTPNDDETWGFPGEEQDTDATSLFSVTTSKTAADDQGNREDNSIEKDKIKLIDPETGEETDGPVKAYATVDGKRVEVGSYTYDPNTGKITFTPNDDFKAGADPEPVEVKGTDKNGKSTTATYQPHFVPKEETVTFTRTIEYKYDDGTPVLDDEGKPIVVTQEITFKREATSIDENHEPVWDEWTPSTATMNEVISPVPDRDGYVPGQDKVDEITGLTEADRDKKNDKYPDITVVYTKPPTADEKHTYAAPGATQKGTPAFTAGSKRLTSFTLIDDAGNPVDKIEVPGVGTYMCDPNTGEVTFVPDPAFKPEEGSEETLTGATVRVLGTDENGNSDIGEYTPHVVDNVQKRTVKRTIEYKYDDGTPVLDEDGNPKVEVEELEFMRTGTVDPETGMVSWEEWEPQSYETVPSDKIAGWTPDRRSAAGHKTTPADGDETLEVIYSKTQYTVTYKNGDHGKSTGSSSNKEYGGTPQDNTTTPDSGYKFTGTFNYVITDEDGNVIDEGTTDDPESIEVIGNIEFTPLYEANKYMLKYDANGGSGTMDPQSFTGADSSAKSRANTFTREGYDFTGFKAKLPDGSFLKDENGNDLVFASAEDFIEYLHDLGDGAEIVLVAQWEPTKAPAPTPAPPDPEPEPSPSPEPQPDQNPAPTPGKTPASAAATPAASTPRATPKTGDGAPLVALGLLALTALAAAGIAVRRSKA